MFARFQIKEVLVFCLCAPYFFFLQIADWLEGAEAEDASTSFIFVLS